MAKFKAGFDYQDLELERLVKKNEVVEMTVKRANEVNKKLEKHGTALHRIDDEEK